MSTPLVDRFHFARIPRDKTEILAEVPDPKLADGVATMRLYDPIDDWGGPYGISAKEFAAAMDALPENTTEVRLHVNSPGGMVWEGLAILNLLRQHPAKVVAIVDGLAASAASFVLCGADEVVMMPNSEQMVHSPWGLCVGNATDMAKMAADLEHEGKNLAAIYSDRAGGTVDEWHAIMQAETWFSAEEAVAAGLADRVDSKPADDKAKNRFDLTVFAHAGRANAPAPKPPSRPQAGPSHHEGGSAVAFSDEQITALRQRLGVADDADEATILAALDEALDEQPDPAKPDIPEGHVVVPEARLRDLEAGVAASATVAEKIHAQERTAFLDSVRKKYAPANRAAWEAEYDRDEAGTRAHFEKAPDIIALEPLGHDDDPEMSALDADYRALFGDEKVS